MRGKKDAGHRSRGRLGAHGQGLGRAGSQIQISKTGEIFIDSRDDGGARIGERASDTGSGERIDCAAERLHLETADGQSIESGSAADGKRHRRGVRADRNTRGRNVPAGGKADRSDTGVEPPSVGQREDQGLIAAICKIGVHSLGNHNVTQRSEGRSIGGVQRLVSRDIVAAGRQRDNDVGQKLRRAEGDQPQEQAEPNCCLLDNCEGAVVQESIEVCKGLLLHLVILSLARDRVFASGQTGNGPELASNLRPRIQIDRGPCHQSSSVFLSGSF